MKQRWSETDRIKVGHLVQKLKDDLLLFLGFCNNLGLRLFANDLLE